MPDPKKSESDDKPTAPAAPAAPAVPTPAVKKSESEQEAAPATPATPTPNPIVGPRYKVLSGGLTGAGGVSYGQGEVLTAEQIGDQERVDKLLARKGIEIVHD